MTTAPARDIIIEIADHTDYNNLNKADKDFIHEKITGARFAQKHNVEFELREDQTTKVYSIRSTLN